MIQPQRIDDKVLERTADELASNEVRMSHADLAQNRVLYELTHRMIELQALVKELSERSAPTA